MSKDLTKKLPLSDSEKVSLILTTLQAMEERLTGLEQKIEEILHDELETNHNAPKTST